MTVIGIDPSLNNTGICIKYEDDSYEYVLLSTNATNKFFKAVQEFKDIDLRMIRKETCASGPKSIRKSIFRQVNTTENIYHIAHTAGEIISAIHPDYVVIEAPALAASGYVADLMGLNHAIRLECYRRDIPCYPVPPTTVKLHSVGNGRATKEMMIGTWLRLFPQYKSLEGMKIDDLADAYFLCSFDLESINIEPGE